MYDHALVTGATGLIGRWLVPELTRLGRDVVAIVRRADERRAEYVAWVAAHGGVASRVTLVEGDLASDGLGLDDDGRRLASTARDVFHAGALMQFGMSEQVARRANVDGTRALAELALASPRLRRFVHVSGFKVGDDRPFAELGLDPDGPFDPSPYDALYDRLGGYEASKMESDHLVRDLARTRGLPLARIHPGAVIGDARTGETTQFFGFAPIVEQIYRGKMPAVPGGAQHWLPLVTVDFVAALMARVPEVDDTRGGSYVLLDDAGPQMLELVARVAERVGMRAPRRRVPVGLAKLLLRARVVPGGAEQAEGLAFLADRRYDTSSARRLAQTLGLAWPDLGAAIDRSVDYMLATRFGKRSAPAGAHFAKVAGAATYVVGDRSSADTVLLHGLPLDADSWDAVADRIGGRQLRADLPGLGRSASVPKRAAPRDWMESLLAGASAPLLLVGHSLGTRYALELAAAHPERVSGLVLISPFFLQAPPPAIMRTRPTACLAARGLRRSHLEQLVAGGAKRRPPYSSSSHTSESAGDRRARSAVLDGPASDLARPGAKSRFGLHLADAHAHRAHLQDLLAATKVPVVLIAGERDPLVEATDHRVVVVGTGHFPQLDRPDDVAEVIAKFRGSLATRAAA